MKEKENSDDSDKYSDSEEESMDLRASALLAGGESELLRASSCKIEHELPGTLDPKTSPMN